MDAPLSQRLAMLADSVQRLAPSASAAVDRMAARLRETGAGESAPAIGDIMPRFILPDQEGKLVDLDRVLAKGPAAVVFTRGHWCPFCRLNTYALARLAGRVRDMGRQILAITPERRRFSGMLRAETKAEFPVLTDMDNAYALSLNLVIWVGEELQQIMMKGGRDLPLYQGNPSWLLPLPATFIVASSGLIVDRFIDPDYRNRMDTNRLLASLSATS
jgi:peroxiredoxin